MPVLRVRTCDENIAEFVTHRMNIPDIQRPRDNGKVTEILERMKTDYLADSENIVPYVQGVIQVAEFTNGVKYLFDGQHRYHAVCKFYDEFADDIMSGKCTMTVPVQYFTIDGADDIDDLFLSANKHTPVPDIPLEHRSKIMMNNEICSYFQAQFEEFDIFRSSDSRTVIRRPQIDLTLFQEDIQFIIETMKYKHARDVINAIYAISDEFADRAPGEICGMFDLKLTEKTRACIKEGFFLPLYKKEKSRGPPHYAWVKKIIPKSVKKDVAKPKREHIWGTYVGDKLRSKCPCCGITEISTFSFDVGHVIPRSQGGTEDVANLRPICSVCNNHMGTQDMRDYIADQYPDNYAILFPE